MSLSFNVQVCLYVINTHSIVATSVDRLNVCNAGSNPKTTDEVLNGALKNLEDTLIDCDHQKMADSLMVNLQQVKNESSSDEESVEHKNLMFEDAASSAGCKSVNLLHNSEYDAT